MKTRWFLVLAVGMLSALLSAVEAPAQPAKPPEARNVVLVHGAWADGSSWSEVISRLQAAGMHVTAVQNPLTSLADSAAATRRALALQDGPTVLVAHSWGGTVISETGMDPHPCSADGPRWPAWHSKPSWYAVSKLDQTISPDLERFLAARMKGTTVELEAGHLSLVSHPRQIADLILAAAARGN
jgi:pimeloyl-ACP methyl ester carboxylesterase